MWTLRKRFTFEAAHYLPHHDGKCRRVHGHSWAGEVEVRGDVLEESGPKQGMIVDYGDLSRYVKPIVDEYLDHWDLNQTTGLESPTSEAIAKWLYQKVKILLPSLVAVTIHETCTCSCRYEP